MKILLINLMLLAIITLQTLGETEYMVDIFYPMSETAISLPLNSSGQVKKDYDGFLSYPSKWETEPSLHVSQWEKRGVGIFAELTFLQTTSNFPYYFEFSGKLEEVELLEWTSSSNKNVTFRYPAFSSVSISVAPRTTTWLGHCFVLRGSTGEGKPFDLKLMIREKNSQPLNAEYFGSVPGTKIHTHVDQRSTNEEVSDQGTKSL